ncbi:MAG TPA: TadE/TadG family type IV pilus assembly protein [Bryobacteraceae bacterium]|nr:TadE/TadG family type IV pilus assembly protein [Bryobacteraceae bacterium]
MKLHLRRAQGQRGNAIVEASLILMLLLMILFGCFDFGFALFQYQTLAHKARSAARYAAINPADFAAVRNVVLYDRPTIPEGRSGPAIFGLTPEMVSVSRLDTGKPEDRIVLTVSGYRAAFITPYIAGSITGTPITVSIPVETQ